MVRFDQHLLGGQINDDQIFGMGCRQWINFDAPAAVGEHAVPAAKRLDNYGSLVFLQAVRLSSMGRLCDLGIKYFGGKRHDDGRALGHKSADAAGVVEMMMGRNDVSNRFGRKALFDRFHHRRGARLVQWPLDGDQVIPHLDDYGRVRAALDFVHAAGELVPFNDRRPPEVLVAHIARYSAKYPLRRERLGVGLLTADGLGIEKISAPSGALWRTDLTCSSCNALPLSS